ncbi:MAG: twitching motility protein [Desulfopila sp.]
MHLQSNQSALILEENEQGEISVNVATSNRSGLTAMICEAIATKLMHDEPFQAEILDMLDSDAEE